MKYVLYSLIATALVVGGAVLVFGGPSQSSEKFDGSVFGGLQASIHKSPSCGCCVGFASQARDLGIDADVMNQKDMAAIKREYNIPSEMESCHTTVVGDYFIEGHVPFEAIEKLLAERPDIDGIALPNMPAGSPGMPGKKAGPFDIYQVKDGQYSLFVSI